MVNDRLGGQKSARIILDSLEFETIVKAQEAGDWDTVQRELVQAGKALEAAGADFIENERAADHNGRSSRHPVYDGTGLSPAPAGRAGDRSARLEAEKS